MIWRKLEPDEEIKHGDWLSYDGYDLNSTEAERIAWTRGHNLPELNAACGLIGQTVHKILTPHQTEFFDELQFLGL